MGNLRPAFSVRLADHRDRYREEAVAFRCRVADRGEAAARRYREAWEPILREHPDTILYPTFALGVSDEYRIADEGIGVRKIPPLRGQGQPLRASSSAQP